MTATLQTLTIGGRTQTIVEWAEETGLQYETIRMRVRKGWDEADILSPLGTVRHVNNEPRWRPGGGVPMWPEVNSVPYENDPIARYMVAEHGPFTTMEIAAFMGTSRSRIDQIERQALAKLKLAGLTLEDLTGDKGEMVYPEAGGW